MSTIRLSGQASRSSWLAAGAILGIVAGVIFALFEMTMAAVMGDGFFMPLRMIGAIILGEGALEPTYSLAAAIAGGLVVHMVLSAIYGTVFAAVVSAVGALRDSRLALIAAATIFGFLLWIVNFFIIAPVAFEWFGMADDTVQFVAHTFFFGAALGLLMAMRRD